MEKHSYHNWREIRQELEQVLRNYPLENGKLALGEVEGLLEGLEQSLQSHKRNIFSYFDHFQDAPIGYVVVDWVGTILAANLLFGEMVGQPFNAVTGSNIIEFIHPNFQSQYLSLAKGVLREMGKGSILVKLLGGDKELFVKLECNVFSSDQEEYIRIGLLDVTREVINEQQLIESRERYRAVADYAYSWEYWQDPQGRLLYMSPSCERITGFSKYDFFENPNLIEEIIHPDDKHHFDEHKSVATIPGETRVEHTTEYRITRKDGKVIWIGHACQNIFKEDGTHIGQRATNRDITERKQISEKLTENLNLLSNTQELAHIGSWELDVDTNQLNWSDEIYRIFGIEPQQFEKSYKQFLEIVHPDDRDAVNAAYVNSLRDDASVYEIEHRIVRRDNNEVRYVYEKCYHERDNNGRVIRSVGMVQDITERKQREQKLVISDRIFNHALDMLCIAGFDGYFKTLNPAWSKVLGYSAEELMAKPWLEYVHPDDKEATKNIKASIVDGQEVYQFENRYICKDGTVKWLSWNSFPYPKENIMYGVARDISFKKQAEEKLQSSELQLKEQVEEYTALNEELNQANDELRNVMEDLNESNQRTKAILSAIPDLMFVLNREGVYIDYYSPNDSLLAAKPSEFLGKSPFDILPKEVAEMNKRALELLFETGEYQLFSYSLDGNNETKYFDARLVLFGNDRALAIVRDITEQKKGQLTIAKNEQYLKTILQTTVDGFWITDLEGNLLEVNEAYCKMSGYSHQELLKLKIEQIDVNENSEDIKKHIARIVEVGSDIFETKHRSKDGTIFDVEVSVTYLDADGGQLICFTRDITERKHAEQELLNSNQNINFLANSAMSFVDIHTTNHFFTFIGESVHRLIPEAYILVNSVHPNEQYLKTEAVFGKSHIISKASKIIGYNTVGKTWEINESFLELANGKLATLDGGVYELSFKQLPKVVASAIDKLLNINKISSLAVISNGSIVSNIVIILPQGVTITNAETLEIFVKQASIAYNRIVAEENLRNSEERFKLSMEATRDGLWDWDVKAKKAYYSPAYYTMLGYEVEGFSTSSTEWKGLVHPDDFERISEEHRNCVNGISDTFDIEFRMKSFSGEWKWIYSRGKVVERDSKGIALRLVGTHVDITDQKENEKALKESEARFKALHNASFGGITIHDKGLILDCNQGLSEITGYSLEELIGMNGLLLIAEETRDMVLNNILVGYEKPYEAMGVRKDGSKYPLRLEARNIPYKGKQVRVVEFRDITEQKSAEIALQQSEERFKMLFEKAPVGYQSLTEDGRFLEVNETWLSMLGYTKEEVIGKWFGDFLAPEYVEGFRERFPIFKAAGKIHSEFKMVRKDGSEVFIAFDGRIGYTPKGEFKQTHCTLNDINEQRKAEQALKAKTAELEAIYNNSPLMMCILDEHQNVVYANNYLVEYFGKTYEKIINSRACGVFGCINATEHEKGCGYGSKCPSCDLNNAIAQTIKTGESLRDVEYNAVVNSNGKNKGISLMAYTSLIKSQKKLVSLIFVDVSERRKMENALRESEEMMRSSQSVAQICSYSTNLNEEDIGKSAWVCSPEFYKIFGIDETYPHTIVGWANFIHPDYREEVFAYHASVVKERKSFNREYKIIRINDGEERWVHGTGELEFDKNGKPIRMHGAIQDITDRKHAERTLQESEEKFRSLVSQAAEMLFMHDMQGNLLEVNNASIQNTCYTREELLGMNVLDIDSEVHDKQDMRAFWQSMNVDDPALIFEGKHKRKDGTIYDAEISISKVFFSGNNYILALARDISERKRAEEALRESEELFRMLAELAPVGIIITDEEQNPAFVSPTFTKIFGYTIDDIPTVSHWFSLAYPDENSRKMIMQEWFEFTEEVKIKGSYSKPLEFPVHCKNGIVKQIEFRLAVSSGIDVIIFTDVTERKLAEEALRESEERFRGLYENATIGIYRTNPDGQILMANPALVKMLEYSSFEELAKRNLSNEGYEASYARSEFMRLIEKNGEVKGLESAWTTRKGETIFVSESARVVRSSNEKPIYYEGTVEDITQRKRAVDSLKASEERINSIFRVAPIGIGVVVNRVLTEVNQTICDITGYAKDELLGETAQILYPTKEEFEFVGKEKYRQIAERGTGTVETLWKRKDGSIINVQLSSTPISQDDLSQGVTFTALDITQRKQTERLRDGRLKLLEFADTHSLPELLKHTLALAEDLTGSQISFYVFIDEESGEIKLNQWSERTEREFCKVTEEFDMHYPIEKAGVWADCIRKRKPIIHNDYSSLPNKKGLPGGHSPLIRELTVPVFRNKRIVAVMAIGNKTTKYDQNDLEMITQLADMAWDIAERKMAEESLLQSESRYRLLFENMTQGFALSEVITDNDGKPVNYRFITVNPAYERLTGLKASNIEGKTIKEVLPKVESYWIETFGEVALTGKPKRYDNYASKLEKHFDTWVFSPKKGQFAVISSDITERKKAEEQVLKLTKGIEQSPATIVITDIDGNIEFVNPMFTEVTGYTAQEAMGQNPRVLKSDYQTQEFYKDLWDTIKGGNDWRGELCNKKKSGELYWESASISPIKNENGEIVNFIAVKEDITDRKNAILALEQNNRLINTMLDNLPVGIFMVDALTGKPLVANEQAKHLMGKGIVEEASTESLAEVYQAYKAGTNQIYPTSQMPIVQGMKGITTHIDDMEVIHPDGTKVLLEVFGCPVYNSKGDIWASLVGFHDITERKKAEVALRESEFTLKEKNEEYLALNEELTESNQRIAAINRDLILARQKAEESDKLKSAFLANMSHEIRTPMNAIIGFSEMLLNPNLPNERKDFFAQILNTACHQLLSVVEDVIDISKIETGQMDVHLGDTQINQTLSRVKEIFLPQANSNGVQITVSNFFADGGDSIITDANKLNQVLTNLVSNAVKFTENGTIHISYSIKNGMVEFSIADTGVGIDKQHHDLIFERFRQVEMGSTRQYGGTGLGLPISKSFIEMLGGYIWLESELGKGTTFFFTIPFKPNYKEEVSKTAEDMEFNFAGKKILIAEDEEANFLYINELIEETGATIIRASNGQEAMDIFFADNSVSIILMDIKMPMVGGIEVTVAIRQRNTSIPIIALTAYAMSGDREKCLSAGCNKYLSKPVRRNELLRAIADLIL